MIDQNVEVYRQTSVLAKQYAQFIIKSGVCRNVDLYQDLLKPEGLPYLQWDNPENLDTGISGLLIFLLELYGETGDEDYIVEIDESIQYLLAYCKQAPSNNYSLFAGRAGVAYLLIQRYLLDRRQTGLLNEASSLLAGADREFLHSSYTSDSLYDGRAGVLLVLIHLYALSGEATLREPILQFTDKVISNARQSTKGLFWNSDQEFFFGPSAGFAFGGSGIGYVFSHLRRYGDRTAFDFILKSVRNFIDSCWVDRFSNWGDFRKDILDEKRLEHYLTSYRKGDYAIFGPENDFSWANGTAGVLLSGLMDEKNSKVSDARQTIERALEDEAPGNVSLFNGLAGIGLACLEQVPASGNLSLKEIISERVLRDEGLVSGEPKLRGGLFHGALGALYFLLRSHRHENGTENILVPFGSQLLPGGEAVPPMISLDLNEVRKQFLKGYFPRTVGLLEASAPAALLNFFEESGLMEASTESEKFTRCLRERLNKMVPPSIYKRVTDLFHLESKRLKYLEAENRSRLQVYLDGLLYKEKVMKNLARSDEWMLEQHICVSTDLEQVATKWDWSFQVDFIDLDQEGIAQKQNQNLSEPARNFSYMLQILDRKEVVETPMIFAFKLLLDIFKEPRKLREALEEIKVFLRSMPVQMLRDLFIELANNKFQSFDEIADDAEWLLLGKIRPLIYQRILLIK